MAVKVLRSEHEAIPAVVARFAREGLMAVRVNHPNVVRVRDAGHDGALRYIVMDLVEGQDLKSFIQRHAPLAPGAALRLTRQILLGLAEVHAAGLLHRDIKPQNILVTDDLHTTLIDFGIARRIIDDDPTEQGVALGSAAYMAPEQALGEPLGPACDLYAVGTILFELLTGRVPFPGDDPRQVLLQQIYEAPPALAGLDLRLAGVVRRALAKRPGDRFGSVSEMLTAVDAAERARRRASLVAARATAASGTRRRLVSALATMAALLALATGLLVATHDGDRQANGAAPAPSVTTPAPDTTQRDASQTSPGREPARSLPTEGAPPPTPARSTVPPAKAPAQAPAPAATVTVTPVATEPPVVEIAQPDPPPAPTPVAAPAVTPAVGDAPIPPPVSVPAVVSADTGDAAVESGPSPSVEQAAEPSGAAEAPGMDPAHRVPPLPPAPPPAGRVAPWPPRTGSPWARAAPGVVPPPWANRQRSHPPYAGRPAATAPAAINDQPGGRVGMWHAEGHRPPGSEPGGGDRHHARHRGGG